MSKKGISVEVPMELLMDEDLVKETNKTIELNGYTKNFSSRIDMLFGKGMFSFFSNVNSTRETIVAKHSCGYVWKPYVSNLLKKETKGYENLIGCPYCSQKAKKTTRAYDFIVRTASGGICCLAPGVEYINDKTSILHYCSACDDTFMRRPSDLINQSEFCSLCSARSQGEAFIKKYLKKVKISYIGNYRIYNCKRINVLPFDFAIFDKEGNLLGLIEFDGRQHFESTKSTWEGYDYNITHERDSIKTQYCRENHIPFIRIKYNQFYKLDEILDDFLKNMNTYVGTNNFYGMTQEEYYV